MSKAYSVGYGKPPKAGQFKPGRSGNKKGRPRGTQNLKTDIMDELDASILIKENGKPKTISKQRAMVKSIMARAINGDTKAANLVFKLVTTIIGADPSHGKPVDLSKADQAILDSFKAEMLKDLAKKGAKS